jgi:ubiquinone biosynthesis protein Coq4
MLNYMHPNAALTLRDAIAQLREEDAKERDVAPTVAPEVERSMTAHDAVHVIFACDTSDRGEAIAHAWMLLGTTVTRRQLRDVMGTRDHRAFARELGHARRVMALVSALPSIAAAALRARRMTRRWSWTDYDRYLNTPLVDIRREYGVRVPARRHTAD